jgi:hypothetical protein
MTETDTITGAPEQVPVATLLRDTVLNYLATTAPDPAEALFRDAPRPDASAESRAADAVHAKTWSLHLFRVASDLTDAAWWWQRMPRRQIGLRIDTGISDQWLRDMVRIALSDVEDLDDMVRCVRDLVPDVARQLAADTPDPDLRAEYLKIANDEDDDA